VAHDARGRNHHASPRKEWARSVDSAARPSSRKIIDVIGKGARTTRDLGERAVGKTAIVRGSPSRLVRGDVDVVPAHGKGDRRARYGAHRRGTSLTRIVSGAHAGLEAERANATRQVIVFIDERIQTLWRGLTGEGAQGRRHELKRLSRAELPCRTDRRRRRVKKHIEQDPDSSGRLVKIFFFRFVCRRRRARRRPPKSPYGEARRRL